MPWRTSVAAPSGVRRTSSARWSGDGCWQSSTSLSTGIVRRVRSFLDWPTGSVYLASESTIYRILREEKQLAHRGRSRPRAHRRPEALTASAPGQVWSWDITYLKSPIRGIFYYLYLIMDVWSRKIVGWEVHEQELAELAAPLVEQTCRKEGIERDLLILHADNGGPMKGGTMLSTLQRLGVAASFSRPQVSDDNPYSESLFKTMKYRPEYPEQPFDGIEDARRWVARFVDWYNRRASAQCNPFHHTPAAA